MSFLDGLRFWLILVYGLICFLNSDIRLENNQNQAKIQRSCWFLKKNLDKTDMAFLLTWIIHKSRLLQMQGAGHEVRGPSLRMLCNKADAVRSACLNG